jgi:trehalose-6-phosphate synthase
MEDDFGLATSAFTICSFWKSEAMALMGELDEAISMFRHLLTIMNPVGLFSVDMMALHRLAQFCVVSSLHDGMNLVAKEFVASRADNDGVLILSEFTGSARGLTDALQVNPFEVQAICARY